jgi:hypothetical protein
MRLFEDWDWMKFCPLVRQLPLGLRSTSRPALGCVPTLEDPTGDEKNPFESVQAMMLENLEKVQGATQSYIDMVAKAMGGFPGCR